MKNKEENTLTLEEAKTRLAQLLIKLAQNAIYHNDIIDQVKELELYIASLEKEKDE